MESQQKINQASEESSIVQERLNWKLAYRDDAQVVQGLYAGEDIEEMHELSDLGLMELVGFNAQQCEEGLTKRGDALRGTKKKQGPLSAQCLADNISKLNEEEIEQLFNQMVQLLAGRGFFKGSLLVALDGSK